MTRRRLLRGALLGALCAAVIAAISLIDPTFLGAEWLLRDAFTPAVAARTKPDPRIVVVTLSEESVHVLSQAGYGRPPYPRGVWAAAIRELRRAGARVIALDMVLAEEDLAHPDQDRELAEALRGAPVVLGVQTKPQDQSPGEFAKDLWQIAGTPPSNERFGITPPHPSFRDAAGIGTIRIASSSRSDTVHDYPIADRLAGGYAPSLALDTVRVFLGAKRDGQWNGSTFTFAGRRVPMRRGRFDIRWHGTAGNELRYNAIDLHRVLAAEQNAYPPEEIAKFEAQFRGRVVLIGTTAAGLFDLRPTPLSAASAGVEIHANAVDDLLNGRFNRDAPLGVQLLLILAAGAALGALVDSTRSQWLSALIAIAFAGGWAAGGFGALAAGVVVRTVAGITSVALAYVAITVINFTAEQKQTAVLKTTFGRYVSPQILEHILAHPERVQLGGERRDLTILFSDIRGFTSISEASEPEEVVEMLNEYLTRMVEILLAHGGTLDKFIGDAVMGFWNAPAADAEHPRHAVRCAIAMIQETARLRARWETEGKASLRIGIGINSGDAVVGNIGAEKVFGYTVIGDAVNLASRLEGKNKDYGTEIIISEFTLARIGDEFETVYLDDVKVKGKEKAVKIYQVVR